MTNFILNISKFKPSRKLLTLMVLSIISFLPFIANAQKRDHLTETEAEMIREAQELDRRTDVFIKAVERRILLINGGKLNEKDLEKFGEPKGTKAQFLWDISKIMLEAIDKIEDVAARDEKNSLISPSIHALADASRKFLPQFETFKSTYTDKMEQAAILSAIDYANQIIEASANVPKVEKKKKKSNKQN